MKRYFEVLDAEPEKGAKDWANTFADDGKFVNGTRIIEGSKGVWCNQLSPRDSQLISRKQAFEQERHQYWRGWPNLYHVVKRIYVLQGTEGSDFIVIGNWAIKRPDGSTLERDTAANFKLVDQSGELKIQKVEVYAVGFSINIYPRRLTALTLCSGPNSIAGNHDCCLNHGCGTGLLADEKGLVARFVGYSNVLDLWNRWQI
jgi:hypothetical protein